MSMILSAAVRVRVLPGFQARGRRGCVREIVLTLTVSLRTRGVCVFMDVMCVCVGGGHLGVGWRAWGG